MKKINGVLVGFREWLVGSQSLRASAARVLITVVIIVLMVVAGILTACGPQQDMVVTLRHVGVSPNAERALPMPSACTDGTKFSYAITAYDKWESGKDRVALQETTAYGYKFSDELIFPRETLSVPQKTDLIIRTLSLSSAEWPCGNARIAVVYKIENGAAKFWFVVRHWLEPNPPLPDDVVGIW